MIITVRCLGRLHRVRLRRGRLQLLDHGSLAQARLAAELGPVRCWEVLKAVRARAWRQLPEPLRTQLTTRRGTGGTPKSKGGWTLDTLRWAAATRRYAPLLQALQARGVKASLYTTREGGRVHVRIVGGPSALLEWDGAWKLGAAWQQAATAVEWDESGRRWASPVWGDGDFCRVCGTRVYVSRRWRAGMARHAHTRKHQQRVRAALEEALASWEKRG